MIYCEVMYKVLYYVVYWNPFYIVTLYFLGDLT